MSWYNTYTSRNDRRTLFCNLTDTENDNAQAKKKYEACKQQIVLLIVILM